MAWYAPQQQRPPLPPRPTSTYPSSDYDNYASNRQSFSSPPPIQYDTQPMGYDQTSMPPPPPPNQYQQQYNQPYRAPSPQPQPDYNWNGAPVNHNHRASSYVRIALRLDELRWKPELDTDMRRRTLNLSSISHHRNSSSNNITNPLSPAHTLLRPAIPPRRDREVYTPTTLYLYPHQRLNYRGRLRDVRYRAPPRSRSPRRCLHHPSTTLHNPHLHQLHLPPRHRPLQPLLHQLHRSPRRKVFRSHYPRSTAVVTSNNVSGHKTCCVFSRGT